jgi:hypothetical protein
MNTALTVRKVSGGRLVEYESITSPALRARRVAYHHRGAEKQDSGFRKSLD